MMGAEGSMIFWMMGMGLIATVIVILLVAGLVYLLVRSLGGGERNRVEDGAINELRRRLASGEITKDEFVPLREVLGERSSAR